MNICKGVVIAMIEIKLLVNDIDYEKTAETLLPALAEHMRENGGGAFGAFRTFFNAGLIRNSVCKSDIIENVAFEQG